MALIGNVLKLLAKIVLISWGLTAAASETGGAILKFVKKVAAIDSSGIVKKADFDAKTSDIKGKIPSITNLATIAYRNIRGSGLKDDSFTGLATTAALNDIKSIRPNVSAFVVKADYDKKNWWNLEKNKLDHEHYKYITSQHFHKLVLKIFAARWEQADLLTETEIADFVKR